MARSGYHGFTCEHLDVLSMPMITSHHIRDFGRLYGNVTILPIIHYTILRVSRMLRIFYQLESKLKLVTMLTVLVIPTFISTGAVAIDFIPDFLKSTKINRNIWKQQEQHVALAPQSNGKTSRFSPSQHPVILDFADAQDALRSLELWVDGGFFRNEEAIPVLNPGQIATLARYMVEGLSQARPDEDVVFVVRGYGNLALDVVREKFWTAGRVFYKDGKLNVIIGTFQVKKDRGVRQAEGAHGVLGNTADLHFDHGSRDGKARMPGRVVSSPGVALNTERSRERPDWIQIDIATAAAAYRDSLIPDEVKKRDAKVHQEAAKLTVERRQMREEMARLRKQLDIIKSGGAQLPDLEQRLSTLQELKNKDLISDTEFQSRRQSTLEEI